MNPRQDAQIYFASDNETNKKQFVRKFTSWNYSTTCISLNELILSTKQIYYDPLEPMVLDLLHSNQGISTTQIIKFAQTQVKIPIFLCHDSFAFR